MARVSANFWRPCVQRGLRAALLFCCLCSGCHSIQFGTILAPTFDAEHAPPRAVFGEPLVAAPAFAAEAPVTVGGDASIAPVVAQEAMPAAGQRIDLATALRLAGAENPTIALAEEAVRARLAERMQARALLFPSLDLGSNLRLHRGNFLSAGGSILDVNTQSLYYGFGAGAIGARSPTVPGLRLVAHLGDAYFAPQAAQEKVAQSRFDSDSTHLYILMEVGVRYLALVDAEARLSAYQQTLRELAEIETLTRNFADKKAGAGRESDAQRARAEAMLVRAQMEGMQETIGVAAAELARLLDIDPALTLRAADPMPPILELVDRNLSLAHLLEMALANHPEIAARNADVSYQEIRLRQERVRPFLPTIAVGFSAGDFGGGNQSLAPRLQNFAGRTDLDVAAVWSLQQLGVGNRAVQNVARAGLESALVERARTIDRIRAEVAEAHALAAARRQEMELARKRIDLAQRAYTQDLARIRNREGLPLEVLQSANQLKDARQDLVRSMIGYSQAQLRLFAALGNAPR